MTEKRFYLLNYNNHPIYDSLNDKEYNAQFKKQRENLCDLLNEQHETIQRLKQNIDELIQIDVEEDLLKENKQLKEQLSEAKADEKQLGISFMGYKMKLIEVLQKKYDKVKGKTLYADVYTEIAEEMGVDLE